MDEERLSYLCSQAAQERLTLDELSELLGYTALDSKIWDLILLEAFLRNGNQTE